MKIKRRVKRRLIDSAILIAVFILAVIAFSYLTNQGNDSMTADMGVAEYPQVSFSYDGYSFNSVPGYIREMDLTSVRDTISPVRNQQLELLIQSHGTKIRKLTYRVYTLDGQDKLLEADINSPKETEKLDLSQKDLLAEERVLQAVLLTEDDREISYYTRIADASGAHLLECLDYVRAFHENALSKAEGSGISSAIEPSEEGDNTTFSHVTIHSDYGHVTWGELEPQVEGGERWSIKEMNNVYTCVQLEYMVRCKGEENEEDVYKVTEFFRIRHSADAKRTYLLDYDRQMSQVFDPVRQVLSANGVLLGITDYDVPYLINEDGTIVSFVQAGELWNYNKNTDEVSLVFSFAAAENTDERNLTAQHEIRLIETDDAGNLTFAVYGYMNRGTHEGEVGVAVYYYDISTSSVEEKVFISTQKSWEHAINELGKLVYYSVDRNLLYVLADGNLYEIDVEKDKRTTLVEGLEEDEYVVSGDGHMVAYLTKSEDGVAGSVTVENLATGSVRTAQCASGERITPLGFVKNDFVYGVSRTEEAGTTVSGESVSPMYKVEIQNSKSEVIKTYEQEKIYILSAEIKENMITLHRATKKGNSYTQTSEDYITNNEEEKESNIFLESYTTQLKETQMRLTYSDGIADKEPKYLKPRQVRVEDPVVVTFENTDDKEKCYVYGHGRMQGEYDKAGEAIQAALECSGVVVSSEQQYVWESGNRDLTYSISGKDEEIAAIRQQLSEGTAPMDVMNELSDGRGLDLTGCKCEDLLYVINQGSPVIAMLNAKDAVLLIGYQDSTVTYLDVEKGEKHSVTCEKMDEMTKGSGHTYVGKV